MKKEIGYTWKLGLFVSLGLLLLVATIYYIGKQKNLFGSTFELHTIFKNVGGLRVGNNVRYSGINIGTVKSIYLLTDTNVQVNLIVQNEVQKFIKTDALAGIGSDGLMGDMVLVITPGSSGNPCVKDKDFIISKIAIDMDDVKNSLKKNLDNLSTITAQLAIFTGKINTGNGALSKLISDEEFSGSLKNTLTNLQTSSNEFATFTVNLNKGKTLTNLQNSSAEFANFTAKMNNKNGILYKVMNDKQFSNSLDSTLLNLKDGSKKLNETLEAAKDNFLLKPYFKKIKKTKAAKESAILKKAELDKKNLELKIEDKQSIIDSLK
jgi:phospholipid/cholesterol/gamma-HCH transport system substrate-binding protein